MAIDPAWLKWHDGIIVKFAQTAYDDRALPSGELDCIRLAVLADALEEAGCTCVDIVEHLCVRQGRTCAAAGSSICCWGRRDGGESSCIQSEIADTLIRNEATSRGFAMTKLMVDEKTASKLRGSKNPVLLCDPAGLVIGKVMPPSPYDDVAVPFTEAELQRAEQETDEFKLSEILAELEKS